MNPYLEKFIENKFKKPGKALDLGCGKNFNMAGLQAIGWKTEGVDKITGTDLEKLYISKKAPFDLVVCTYVIHKLKNKKVVIKSAYENLNKDGWLFIHTFDSSDKMSKNALTKKELSDIISSQGFVIKDLKTFSFFDNEPDHRHWHRITEVSAQKQSSLNN